MPVGILFSLLAALLANDIADQKRLAWQAAHNELSADHYRLHA